MSGTLKCNPLNFLFLKQDSENEDLKHMPHSLCYISEHRHSMYGDLRTFG